VSGSIRISGQVARAARTIGINHQVGELEVRFQIEDHRSPQCRINVVSRQPAAKGCVAPAKE